MFFYALRGQSKYTELFVETQREKSDCSGTFSFLVGPNKNSFHSELEIHNRASHGFTKELI